MDEYIAREATYTIAKKICDAIRNGEYHSAVFAYDIMDWIDDVPAADVVPVVRCKDCRYSMDDKIFGGMWCRGRKVTPDWFCADGAKRDGEA